MIPTALMIFRILEASEDADFEGSWETPCGGWFLVAETVHNIVKYVIAAKEPMRERRDKELRLGKSWEMKMAKQTNIKHHSALDKLLPFAESKIRACNDSRVAPPLIMNIVHVPPDRYIVGNIARNFPSFGPKNNNNNHNN